MADINDYSQNVSIHDETSDAAVTTSDLGGGRRGLDVNATVSNDESPTRYQLEADYEATGTSVATTDTTLFSYTGVGVISFIAVSSSTTSNFEVIINVDGTERLRISMSDLGSDIGLTSGDTPIWVATANKQFRYHPTPEIGFTSSFSVEARYTLATGTTDLTHLILYKEKT